MRNRGTAGQSVRCLSSSPAGSARKAYLRFQCSAHGIAYHREPASWALENVTMDAEMPGCIYEPVAVILSDIADSSDSILIKEARDWPTPVKTASGLSERLSSNAGWSTSSVECVVLYRELTAGATFDAWRQYVASVGEVALLIGSVSVRQERQQRKHCEMGRLTITGPKSLWAEARSTGVPIEGRIEALSALAQTEPEDVGRYVVEELSRDRLPDQWRDALITFAEHLLVEDALLRERFRQLLLDYAGRLRLSPRPRTCYVVWSAIRTYTSLISAAEAPSLLPLLGPPDPIETRLITLQGIVHLFEKKPAEDSKSATELADRIYELANKFLDIDWLVPGEKATIGQVATQSLAALGDKRLADCVSKVRSLGKRWVTRMIAQKLEVLLEMWNMHEDAKQSETFSFVRQQLNALLR